MGFPLFTCVLCGKQVTRPKSYALKSLTGQEGRACRDHLEVMETMEKKFQEELHQKTMEQIDRNLQVISMTSFIRVAYSIKGVEPNSIYFQWKQNGVAQDLIEEVKREVDKRGGPQMSEEEIMTSLITATTFFHKNTQPVASA